MSEFLALKQETYKTQRAASRGPGITLVAGHNEYTASFDCAMKAAETLGRDRLTSMVDGLDYKIPWYRIPFDQVSEAIRKLSARHPVALLDYAATEHGGRYVLIWRIENTALELERASSTDLDDY